LPTLFRRLESLPYLTALFLFGSLARGERKPLSDLDLAVLFREGLTKEEIFELELELRGVISEAAGTEEFDLIVLDVAPVRFVYNVFKEGKLVFCKDEARLIDLHEEVVRKHLDFSHYRDQFNRVFLEGVGY